MRRPDSAADPRCLFTLQPTYPVPGRCRRRLLSQRTCAFSPTVPRTAPKTSAVPGRPRCSSSRQPRCSDPADVEATFRQRTSTFAVAELQAATHNPHHPDQLSRPTNDPASARKHRSSHRTLSLRRTAFRPDSLCLGTQSVQPRGVSRLRGSDLVPRLLIADHPRPPWVIIRSDRLGCPQIHTCKRNADWGRAKSDRGGDGRPIACRRKPSGAVGFVLGPWVSIGVFRWRVGFLRRKDLAVKGSPPSSAGRNSR